MPQGVNASFYHEIDPRWAVLGSVGWQQWSKFGEVEVGVDSNNPIGLTTRLDFKDTWHVAGGAQYKWSDTWLLNAGIAYDSGFQDNNAVALALPANAAWRFGIGAQKEESKTFNWGLELRVPVRGKPALEYCRQCACRAGWPWRRGRFVQQRRVLLPCRQWQLEVLKRVHLQEGSQ